MPVSGLVLTLATADADALAATLAALAADARVSVGPRDGHRLALALDTPSRQADEAAWDDLRALPAVAWIDLVYVTIDPREADPASTPSASGGSRP